MLLTGSFAEKKRLTYGKPQSLQVPPVREIVVLFGVWLTTILSAKVIRRLPTNVNSVRKCNESKAAVQDQVRIWKRTLSPCMG